jgi:hypothetical protein
LLLTEVDEEVLRENIIVESWGLRKRILSTINELLQQYRFVSFKFAFRDNLPWTHSLTIFSTLAAADNETNIASKSLARSSVTVARNKLLTIDEISKILNNHIETEVIPKWENEK